MARMFAVLGLGEALARLVGFAATAYLARRLGAGAYGILAVAAAIVLYFSHLADFSMELLGARAIAREPDAVDTLVPPLVLARLGVAAGCIALLCAIGLLLTQPDGAILAASAFSLVGIAASTRFVFVGTSRPAAVAAARLTAELLALGLTVLLVRDAGDLGATPLTRVVAEGCTAVLLVLALRRLGYRLPVRRAPELVRPLFRSAAPLVPHAILGLAIFNSDLIFLRAMRDAATAGLYASAYALISFLLNLGVTYGNSLLPALAKGGTDAAEQRTLYDHAMIQVLTVALPLTAGGCLVAGGLIRVVFGAAYAAAVPPLQVLLWSIVAAWVRNVVQMGLVARDQQAFVLRTTVWSAGANLLLNLALIPRFGMLGAAAATLATEAFRTLVALAYAARLGLPFGVMSRLWRPVLGTVAMAAVLWLVPMEPVLLAVAMGAVVYGVMLVATGGLRWSEGRPHLAV